jgi:hypothetical protein
LTQGSGLTFDAQLCERAISDAMTELFTAALGLAVPWRKAVCFAPQTHEIHFDVVCDAARLPCPRCAAPEQPTHDRLHAIGSICISSSTEP